jgi:hypothetical protein
MNFANSMVSFDSPAEKKALNKLNVRRKPSLEKIVLGGKLSHFIKSGTGRADLARLAGIVLLLFIYL